MSQLRSTGRKGLQVLWRGGFYNGMGCECTFRGFSARCRADKNPDGEEGIAWFPALSLSLSLSLVLYLVVVVVVVNAIA